MTAVKGSLIAVTVAMVACKLAWAAEPAGPLRAVQAVMGVTIRASGGQTPDTGDTSTSYFDPDSLMVFYTAAFTKDLAAAVVHMKANHEQMFLGYEPVIGGQDNCEVKNVTYDVGDKKDGVTPVRVEFSAFECFGGDWLNVRSKVVFDVVQEGIGKPELWYYIDDIRQVDDGGKTIGSLREQFRLLARE